MVPTPAKTFHFHFVSVGCSKSSVIKYIPPQGPGEPPPMPPPPIPPVPMPPAPPSEPELLELELAIPPPPAEPELLELELPIPPPPSELLDEPVDVEPSRGS